MTYHKTVRPSCTHTFIFVHSGSYIFLIQIKDVVFLILTAEPVSFFRSCFFFPFFLLHFFGNFRIFWACYSRSEKQCTKTKCYTQTTRFRQKENV